MKFKSNQAPLSSLMEEVLLQQGLQTLAAPVEQAFPPEAAYHEEHNFGISCWYYCTNLQFKVKAAIFSGSYKLKGHEEQTKPMYHNK